MRAYSHWPPSGRELSAPCFAGVVVAFAGAGADVPVVLGSSEATGPEAGADAAVELVGLDFGPAGLPPAPQAERTKVMDAARAKMAERWIVFKIIFLLMAVGIDLIEVAAIPTTPATTIIDFYDCHDIYFLGRDGHAG